MALLWCGLQNQSKSHQLSRSNILIVTLAFPVQYHKMSQAITGHWYDVIRCYVSKCICWYLVNRTPITINTDACFKIGIIILFPVLCCIMLYCLNRLSIYCSTICIVTVIIMYHNVFITSKLQNTTSEVKYSEIKESFSVFCLHVRCSKYIVIFLKMHI